MQTACEYKKNTKRKEEEKNCDLKFENKRDFRHNSDYHTKGQHPDHKGSFYQKKTTYGEDQDVQQKKTQLFYTSETSTCTVFFINIVFVFHKTQLLKNIKKCLAKGKKKYLAKEDMTILKAHTLTLKAALEKKNNMLHKKIENQEITRSTAEEDTAIPDF